MPAPLIGSVLLIAGAEAAVFRHKNALQAWKLGDDGELLACHQQAQLFQDSPAEKRMSHDVRDLAQVKRELASWVKWQRTLHYLIAGMDAQLRDSTRTLALELAEEYLADEPAAQMAKARLFGCPLPADADLPGAQRLAQPFIRCTRLYHELEQTHEAIQPVKQILEQLAERYATPEQDAHSIYVALVDNGVAAAASSAVAQHDRKAAEELLWQFSRKPDLLKNCPELNKILGGLCQQLLTTLLPLLPKTSGTPALIVMQESAQYEVEPVQQDPLLAALHAELEKAKSGKKPHHSSTRDDKAAADKQKQFILDAHSKGQAGKVQQLVIALIRSQLQNGKPTHLCKSLCSLAKVLTQRHDEALAQRLYEVAKLANQNDVVSYNGYAETLRSLGQYREALTAYGEAKTRFPQDVVCHNGYAETLRSLGQYREALTAYDEAKTRFPNDEVCHNGYADTLRSLGQYSESLTAYGEAKTRFPNDEVCHNGYAETLRSLGQPMQAMAEYRQTMLRFPNNRVVANALACMLIEQGELAEAEKLLTEYFTAQHDWRDHHALAMLKLKQGDTITAEKMLREGAENALLPSDRTVFRQTLSTLYLRQQKFAQAEQTLRPSSAQIIEFPLDRVLRAHAMAGMNQLSAASACLAQVETESAQIIELKQFVARRFGLSTGSQAATQPDPSLEQALCDAEFNYLLRAA